MKTTAMVPTCSALPHVFRRENEAVDCEPEDLDPTIVRRYKLRGMVVHSGQASGGHYYSYIKVNSKWLKDIIQPPPPTSRYVNFCSTI